jgi:hypothetical protein
LFLVKESERIVDTVLKEGSPNNRVECSARLPMDGSAGNNLLFPNMQKGLFVESGL